MRAVRRMAVLRMKGKWCPWIRDDRPFTQAFFPSFPLEGMAGHSPDSVLHYQKCVEQEQYMSDPCREKPEGARLWRIGHGTRLGAAEGKTEPVYGRI